MLVLLIKCAPDPMLWISLVALVPVCWFHLGSIIKLRSCRYKTRSAYNFTNTSFYLRVTFLSTRLLRWAVMGFSIDLSPNSHYTDILEGPSRCLYRKWDPFPVSFFFFFFLFLKCKISFLWSQTTWHEIQKSCWRLEGEYATNVGARRLQPAAAWKCTMWCIHVRLDSLFLIFSEQNSLYGWYLISCWQITSIECLEIDIHCVYVLLESLRRASNVSVNVFSKAIVNRCTLSIVAPSDEGRLLTWGGKVES